MAWQDEMVPMVRNIINDVNPTGYIYSDARIESLITTAARLVTISMDFANTYTISVQTTGISPDPTALPDNNFIGLVVLKAACFVDQSAYRTKALAAGIKASLGPALLDTSNGLMGLLYLLEEGTCKAFDDLSRQIQIGNPPAQAILSPFVNNKFDPRLFSSWSYRENGNGMFMATPNSDPFFG